jgi:uncharacterized Zn finger protein
MHDERPPGVWARDEAILAEVGASLAKQSTEIEVHIPLALANAAVDAWHRHDDSDADLGDESFEERVVRHRAAALAMIGVAVEERGRTDGEHVVVKLDAWFIGDALGAADDRGLIEP